MKLAHQEGVQDLTLTNDNSVDVPYQAHSRIGYP